MKGNPIIIWIVCVVVYALGALANMENGNWGAVFACVGATINAAVVCKLIALHNQVK
jgi:hypothetical protein